MLPALKEVIVATRNKGKVEEFRTLLAPLGIQVKSLIDVPAEAVPEVEEDGETFADNAAKKARAAAAALGLPALADDSGLCVNALGGAPGVRSARYAGESATDAENNAKLLRELRQLRGTEAANDPLSTARFVCVLALAAPGSGDVLFAEGFVEGEIISEARGTNGFGYDPLFYIADLRKTFAELEPEQKNAISHRSKALQSLVRQLKNR